VGGKNGGFIYYLHVHAKKYVSSILAPA